MYVPLTIETRTHGKKNSWQELRAIVESNENDQKLQKRLRLAGLTPLNNSLMMSVDEGMVKYEIPVFCINEARSYSSKPSALNNLKNSYVAAVVTVRFDE
jgi:hypothetical protein